MELYDNKEKNIDIYALNITFFIDDGDSCSKHARSICAFSSISSRFVMITECVVKVQKGVMFLLKKIFEYFMDNHWRMIFFTGNLEEYSKAKYKLFSNGIKVKAKIISQREIGGIISVGGSRNASYEIYVQSKEIHIANSIIHSL